MYPSIIEDQFRVDNQLFLKAFLNDTNNKVISIKRELKIYSTKGGRISTKCHFISLKVHNTL